MAAVMPIRAVLLKVGIAGVATADFEDFVEDLHAHGQRFCRGVDARAGEELGHMRDRRPAVTESEPIFVVHRAIERVVKQTEAIHRMSAPESGRLTDEARFDELREAVGARRVIAELAIVGIDEPGVAIEHVPFLMLLKMRDYGGDGAGEERIVGVEIGDDLASAAAQALVDGVGLPAITLGLPGETLAITSKDVNGTIGRAAVEDEILDVWVVLSQHAFDGAAKEGCLVEGRRDDRNDRQHGGDG